MNCKKITSCKVPLHDGSAGERVELAFKGATWVRRERICGVCGAQFWTGEIDEDVIKRLVSPSGNTDLEDLVNPFESLVGEPQAQDINGATRELARELIHASAWWDHPSGRYVRAPRQADNVCNLQSGWLVAFGANSFLVGRAIKRCTLVLDEIKSRIQRQEDFSGEEVIKMLERPISISVCNSSGSEYEYPPFIGKLRFGSQAIDVRDAAIYLMKTVGVYELLPIVSRPDEPQLSWPGHMQLRRY